MDIFTHPITVFPMLPMGNFFKMFCKSPHKTLHVESQGWDACVLLCTLSYIGCAICGISGQSDEFDGVAMKPAGFA
jgi:hypothetical protein